VVHPQFDRDLVLKLAKSPMEAPDRSAIIAEGRLLAGLEHPNIVQVHDLDFHQGRPYLVMEYIRARTLTQYAREQKISPRRAATLIAEIAGAVGFVHRRGVVHQDIKPANILIDETDRPRLIDFGLAWQQDAWCGPSAGSEGGTYAYIAPEQARAEPDRVRTLADVFALGAALYFLLTGQAPFAAATPGESWERARRGDFDGSALKQAGVPRPLEQICLKAMAHEPGRRYATAEDLASDLDRWLHRPRWAVPLVATVALLLAGVLSWRLLRPGPPPQRPDPHPPDQNSPAATQDRDKVPVPGPAAPGVGRPGAPKGPQYLVRVNRDGQIFDLKDAVPLRTGDKLTIHCDLPRGLHTSLFWFDTEGKLTELEPVAVNSADSGDHLIYPPPNRDASPRVVPLLGPPGTELVLICARSSRPVGREDVAELLIRARRSGPVGREDVAKLFAGGHPLPPLPSRAVVRWDREDFQVELSRRVGAPERDPIGEVQDLLEKIQQISRDQFDFVAGVSFFHQDRP
jgi:hypothetical protein